jgi:Tfp pilus assembly protein PilF
MLRKSLSIAAASALFCSTAATAQVYETTDRAPGYSAILSADYATAERELRSAPVDVSDPARNINLGIVLAKTGHPDLAAREFQQVLASDEVTVTVLNGYSVSSHDVARRALALLERGMLGR